MRGSRRFPGPRGGGQPWNPPNSQTRERSPVRQILRNRLDGDGGLAPNQQQTYRHKIPFKQHSSPQKHSQFNPPNYNEQEEFRPEIPQQQRPRFSPPTRLNNRRPMNFGNRNSSSEPQFQSPGSFAPRHNISTNSTNRFQNPPPPRIGFNPLQRFQKANENLTFLQELELRNPSDDSKKSKQQPWESNKPLSRPMNVQKVAPDPQQQHQYSDFEYDNDQSEVIHGDTEGFDDNNFIPPPAAVNISSLYSSNRELNSAPPRQILRSQEAPRYQREPILPTQVPHSSSYDQQHSDVEYNQSQIGNSRSESFHQNKSNFLTPTIYSMRKELNQGPPPRPYELLSNQDISRPQQREPLSTPVRHSPPTQLQEVNLAYIESQIQAIRAKNTISRSEDFHKNNSGVLSPSVNSNPLNSAPRSYELFPTEETSRYSREPIPAPVQAQQSPPVRHQQSSLPYHQSQVESILGDATSESLYKNTSSFLPPSVVNPSFYSSRKELNPPQTYEPLVQPSLRSPPMKTSGNSTLQHQTFEHRFKDFMDHLQMQCWLKPISNTDHGINRMRIEIEVQSYDKRYREFFAGDFYKDENDAKESAFEIACKGLLNSFPAGLSQVITQDTPQHQREFMDLRSKLGLEFTCIRENKHENGTDYTAFNIQFSRGGSEPETVYGEFSLDVKEAKENAYELAKRQVRYIYGPELDISVEEKTVERTDVEEHSIDWQPSAPKRLYNPLHSAPPFAKKTTPAYALVSPLITKPSSQQEQLPLNDNVEYNRTYEYRFKEHIKVFHLEYALKKIPKFEGGFKIFAYEVTVQGQGGKYSQKTMGEYFRDEAAAMESSFKYSYEKLRTGIYNI